MKKRSGGNFLDRYKGSLANASRLRAFKKIKYIGKED